MYSFKIIIIIISRKCIYNNALHLRNNGNVYFIDYKCPIIVECNCFRALKALYIYMIDITTIFKKCNFFYYLLI